MRKNTIVLLSILLIQVVLIGGSTAETALGTEPLKISKISFLIHPTCWDAQLMPNGKPSPTYVSAVADRRTGAWYDEKEFLEVLAWERRVNQKQREYIRKMGLNEVLVILPNGNNKAMRDLEQFALNHLGHRCIIIRLEGPSKNNNVDYRKLLPDAIKVELLDELFEAVQKNGDDWSGNALEVLFYNRMIALEIEKEFSIRGLHIDPEPVEAVAFGEGFEQSAMSFKTVLPHYLKLSKPIENDFELSVTGMPLLRSATFKTRVALSGDVRLFLWELKDGGFMALFTRARARLSDPQLFVSLPFEPSNLKIFADNGQLYWLPAWAESPSIVKAKTVEPVKVPVFTALQQMSTDKAAYVVVNDISFNEFHRKLLEAPIVPFVR